MVDFPMPLATMETLRALPRVAEVVEAGPFRAPRVSAVLVTVVDEGAPAGATATAARELEQSALGPFAQQLVEALAAQARAPGFT